MEILLTSISYIIMTCYAIIIIIFIKGWLYRKPEQEKIDGKLKISVIIALKNESCNVDKLIKSLSEQSYNKELFEVLLIDDNSEDDTLKKLRNCTRSIKNFYVISQISGINGKKLAIKLGVEHAKGEIITMTDADCTHSNNWITEISNQFAKTKTDLLIGYIQMKGKSIFEKLQILEFSSLTGSGAGACNSGYPIMCNGANLSFKRELFNKINDSLRYDVESGDDMFLLHKAKKLKNEITFSKNRNLVVTTNAENKVSSFISQRLRWAGKSKHYEDRDTIVVAIVTLLANLLQVSSVIYIYYNDSTHFILINIIKVVPDFVLLYLVNSHYSKKRILWYFPILIIIYPLYIILISTIGIMITNIKWKKKRA